jgi:hypothetical protein
VTTQPDAWLKRRYHDDLAPEAERAIRAAGLAWHDEAEARRLLSLAETIAPGHLAVLIARYRYNLYKHRFTQAARGIVAILAIAANRIGIPPDWRLVTAQSADFTVADPDVRFWLFALQAYGYVLLRLGREGEGVAVLRRLTILDRTDQTRTRKLLQVIERRGRED